MMNNESEVFLLNKMTVDIITLTPNEELGS